MIPLTELLETDMKKKYVDLGYSPCYKKEDREEVAELTPNRAYFSPEYIAPRESPNAATIRRYYSTVTPIMENINISIRDEQFEPWLTRYDRGERDSNA